MSSQQQKTQNPVEELVLNFNTNHLSSLINGSEEGYFAKKTIDPHQRQKGGVSGEVVFGSIENVTVEDLPESLSEEGLVLWSATIVKKIGGATAVQFRFRRGARSPMPVSKLQKLTYIFLMLSHHSVLWQARAFLNQNEGGQSISSDFRSRKLLYDTETGERVNAPYKKDLQGNPIEEVKKLSAEHRAVFACGELCLLPIE